jgi:GMP synthase (glutamine-hydrolysing)
MDKIVVLDYGSQTTQLIARRIREIGVYSEILPGDTPATQVVSPKVKGIILSGSPFSVYDHDALLPDPALYKTGLPLLGICYGFQQMVTAYSGRVSNQKTTEYGRAVVTREATNPLFENVPASFTAWMSHGDSIEVLPDAFKCIARSHHHIAAAWDPERTIYGIQFHPEVTHCEYGTTILSNFTCTICKAKQEWTMEAYVEQEGEKIRRTVGDKDVLLLISGGVDSTVVGGLLLKILNRDQVRLLHIDTGLMRKGETEEVTKSLTQLGAKHLSVIDASKRFIGALCGVEDPEQKRRIIGDLFITIQQNEIEKLGITDSFLAQGTLYTDLIESGKGVGNKAHVIKTHHNVRSPLVEKKREQGYIIEPLEHLYKDEVRELGKRLGICKEIVARHPFPGPGLAVRVLGEVTEQKCDILREADFIFIEELKKRELYNKIWQAFCVLLPVRSVGVAGDVRKYGWVVALRAVNSADGMTADVYPFPMRDLIEISSLITNSIPDVGRVVYDVSSKPPSTIEWE